MRLKISRWLWAVALAIVSLTIVAWIALVQTNAKPPADTETTFAWQPPDSNTIATLPDGDLVAYGRDLVARTSLYLGPKGKVAAISNGMNCQNCHLTAGTKTWGNNYSAVHSTYPRFRERSGTVEDIYKRINDCIERSLNGKKLDSGSRELNAIAAYINWVGSNVPKGIAPAGSGIKPISFLDRAADPEKGETIYTTHCRRCHGENGEGALNAEATGYTYPPLWGDHSYNTGAGLFRLSRLAGYIKENMPFDAPLNGRFMTNEEAWDVAAYINSRPRPQKIFYQDWPDIAGKPIDHPFGPYADTFSERQHKYGPFQPIKDAREKMVASKSKK